MSGEITTMATVQEKVRERIQATFMDLLPVEIFNGMVQQHLDIFTKIDLPRIAKEEAEKRLRAVLAEEFKKPGWQEMWAQNGPTPSELLLEVLKQAAPDLVANFFGSLAQRIVMDIRNNSGRY